MAVVVPGKLRSEIIKGRRDPQHLMFWRARKAKNEEKSFKLCNVDDGGGLD